MTSLYPPHSTSKMTPDQVAQVEVMQQKYKRRVAQQQYRPAPARKSIVSRIIPLFLGLVGVLFIFAFILLLGGPGAETAQKTVDTVAIARNSTAAQEMPQVAQDKNEIDKLQAEQDALQKEIADLQSQKAAVQNQIDQTKSLKEQVEQEKLLTTIELEQANRTSRLAAIQAQTQAQTEQARQAAANQASLDAAKLQDRIEREDAKKERWMLVDKALSGALQIFIGVMIMVFVAVSYLVLGWFYWEGRAKHAKNMAAIRKDDTPAATAVDAKPAPNIQTDVGKMLSNAIAYWNTQGVNGREQNQIPSYDMLHMTGADWTTLTDYLVSIHAVTKRIGRGGGTFFVRGNLHEWMLAAMAHRLERVDPLEIAKPPSPTESAPPKN